jgi:hypothetical protein
MAVSQAALTDFPTLPCDLRNTRLSGYAKAAIRGPVLVGQFNWELWSGARDLNPGPHGPEPGICDPAVTRRRPIRLCAPGELLPAEIANRYESEDDRVDGHSQQRCV